MFVSRSSSRQSSGEPFIVGEAIKWIGLQLLCLYTGLCLIAPIALVATLLEEHYAPGSHPPWPSSLAGSIAMYIGGLLGYYMLGRITWKWLKPEWFK